MANPTVLPKTAYDLYDRNVHRVGFDQQAEKLYRQGMSDAFPAGTGGSHTLSEAEDFLNLAHQRSRAEVTVTSTVVAHAKTQGVGTFFASLFGGSKQAAVQKTSGAVLEAPKKKGL